jgi:hypothetical protein
MVRETHPTCKAEAIMRDKDILTFLADLSPNQDYDDKYLIDYELI